MARPNDASARLRFRVMGCAATALVGLALLFLPLGEGLTVLSYDLPFAFRSDLVVTNPIIVWVDRASLDSLGQTDWPPNRHVWAQLLTRLKLEGARLVFFDIVFRTQRPGEDGLFRGYQGARQRGSGRPL